MDAVRASPGIIRRQGEHADHAADPVVHQSMAKERAVAAIVLDHEQADKEARGGNGEQQIKSVSDLEREPHRQPKENERYDRNQNFDDAASMVRFAISRETLRQGAQIGHRGAGIDVRSILQSSLHPRSQMRQPRRLLLYGQRKNLVAISRRSLASALSGTATAGSERLLRPTMIDHSSHRQMTVHTGTAPQTSTRQSRQIDVISSGGRDFGKNCSRLALVTLHFAPIYWCHRLNADHSDGCFIRFMEPVRWPNSTTMPWPNSIRPDGGRRGVSRLVTSGSSEPRRPSVSPWRICRRNV